MEEGKVDSVGIRHFYGDVREIVEQRDAVVGGRGLGEMRESEMRGFRLLSNVWIFSAFWPKKVLFFQFLKIHLEISLGLQNSEIIYIMDFLEPFFFEKIPEKNLFFSFFNLRN